MTDLLLKLFVKNYQHTEDPATRVACGKLASTVGIVCNVLLCLVKLGIGFCFGAVSIVADGANNLSDASGSIMTLLGFKLSAKPADKEHPYGHARLEYLSALGVAAMILVIGIELVINSGKKIVSYFTTAPSQVQTPHFWLAAAVLMLSVCVKLWLMLFYRCLGRRIQSTALIAACADSRNDVISTTAVLIAYVLQTATGWRVDGYMGLAVALFILWSGAKLLRDTVSPLLGEAVSPELSRMVAEEIGKYDMILGIHDLMVHDYGPGRRFASVHVEIDQHQDVLDAHELIDQIEHDFQTQHQISLVIHYDPIVTDDPELNRLYQMISETLSATDPRLRVHDMRMIRGSAQTSLHFDLELPFELQPQQQAICQQLQQLVQQENPLYVVTITTDFIN